MTAEQAAKYLGCESVKAFEKIAARESIPRHYLSARTPRYNRAELDAWLMSLLETTCLPFRSCSPEHTFLSYRDSDLNWEFLPVPFICLKEPTLP